MTRMKSNPKECMGEPKWAVLVDDFVVPMPRQVVSAAVIRAQAGVVQTLALVRDHNSPNDVVIEDDMDVDLSHGNVFYTDDRCNLAPQTQCHDAPKLAFFVDDKAEVVTLPTQSGLTLRDLFGLPRDSPLVRDEEDKSDVAVAPDDEVEFADGPVFYSRAAAPKAIVVTVHNEDNGAETHLNADPSTAIEALIERLYSFFGIERQKDDRLRCESNGKDIYQHQGLTIGEFVRAGQCNCLVWLFAGGTGGASCL